MFYRVVMDVFDVRAKIVFVDKASLPEAPLPDAALSAFDPARGDDIFVRDAAGERRFQLRPASGVVGIAFGQSPDAMQMIRHDDSGDDFEWPRCAGFAECGSQRVDVRG